MADQATVQILGRELEVPICRAEPEQSYPYVQALDIYRDLIKDVEHLRQYCLQRKALLEAQFPITEKDVFESLFELGISPGQKRLYPLGVLYYLFECPRQWGIRLGLQGQTFFCYQGSLEKAVNWYEDFEKKQQLLKEKREAERKKKREQKLKENLEQPRLFQSKKKKRRRKRKRKSGRLGLIKVLPRQGKFTLFLKHPCFLYLRRMVDSISKEEGLAVSSQLEIFTQGLDLAGFPSWFERKVGATEEKLRTHQSAAQGSGKANAHQKVREAPRKSESYFARHVRSKNALYASPKEKPSPGARSSSRSPLNSDSICDTFWMRKRQKELEGAVKKRQIGRILNDWNRERVLRESNQTFFRNRAEEHGTFFGKVVFQTDFLREKTVSASNFRDDLESFKEFANCKEE